MIQQQHAKSFGIVVAGHGSRDADGMREFEQLVELLRERATQHDVTHGYLEFASPTIEQALQTNIDSGNRQIVMVPSILLAARHGKNDMPTEMLAMARSHPDIDFYFGAPLGLDAALLKLAQQQIITAEATSTQDIRRSETCLVVVGRGTTDSDANGDVAKLARMLEEGMDFGGVHVCYSGTAKPLVAEGLRTVVQMGFKRVVVSPFFLFDGILVKRIISAVEIIQQREPNLDVVMAKHLGAHSLVADVMLTRAREAIEGHAAMNCSLCKYRVQIVGYEQQVGEPQQAHHLAVRGLFEKQQETSSVETGYSAYIPHPIEAESMRIINTGRDWSEFPQQNLTILQRLVHTSGDFNAIDDIYLSPGAVETGIRALLRCKRIVTDVTMVQTGLKRTLLEQLEIETWCGVHDRETHLIAKANGITRSATGIRRAFEKFGNDVVVAIGDAPTAIAETTRLIREHGWRPQLVIGLPVGFVGTRESKEDLRRCLQVPRITNSGTRGGSPWAASVVNGLMIDALNQIAAEQLELQETTIGIESV